MEIFPPQPTHHKKVFWLDYSEARNLVILNKLVKTCMKALTEEDLKAITWLAEVSNIVENPYDSKS